MSSPPKYTLTYFNYRGGGEIIRLLFAVGKTPYTDERLEKDVWRSRKQGKILIKFMQQHK